ncbi:protein-glutamate methylesterase/protein-glutamine glutaminase [Bacillus sp. FJAT-45037]|uniref:protein-glutamate methylesterase/protein-glutamine glutaminase n=1 Tax=Bacillus sp. FJAT-45037 TaxID=2011007 RepID=UPI000C2328B7|nr:chemotaxis response regulator protein-glutamate methylesterase [Bacillus sp. FJAT-45037]
MKEIKVLVVDDSAFMRKVISDMLNKDSNIEVIATARNGAEALIKRKSFNPDVITLDVEMPVMDGLETLQRLMEEDSIPVVMISSLTTKGTEQTMLAIEYGAVDFVSKTSGSISLDLHLIEKEIIQKVKLAYKANVSKSFKPKPIEPFQLKREQDNHTIKQKKIIAIGTSTGGPKALKEVLTKLPKTMPAPLLIVQHMPKGFTQSLATRLNMLSQIEVKEAVDGELLRNGVAYIAPGGFHMEAKKVGQAYTVHLHQQEARRGHRPSIDVLFESLAVLNDIQTIAVIMTGMGSDGKAGLTKLKNHGHCYSIAESEQTSVVFGMPKAAIEANIIDEVRNLESISEEIIHRF